MSTCMTTRPGACGPSYTLALVPHPNGMASPARAVRAGVPQLARRVRRGQATGLHVRVRGVHRAARMHEHPALAHATTAAVLLRVGGAPDRLGGRGLEQLPDQAV